MLLPVNGSLKCETLIFDKTLNLSNYPVKIAEMSYYEYVTDFRGNIVKRDTLETSKRIMHIIWRRLNANISYAYYRRQDSGGIKRNGKPTGITGDVLRGKYESTTVDDYQRGFWKNEINLFRPAGLCYVTSKQTIPIIQQLSKIFPFFTCVILSLFFVIVTILFSRLLKIGLIEVAIDVLRVVIGTSMVHSPTAKLNGSVIVCLIVTFMIVNVFMQSQLSTMLLISPKASIIIRNSNDLVKNRYKIYAHMYFLQFYRNSTLENRILPIENLTNCLNLVKTDNTVVCIEDCDFLRYSIQEKDDDLSISKDEFFNRYNVILVREDSPLHRRIEIIYSRLYAHGFTKYLTSLEKLHHKLSFVNNFKQISVCQLKYAFYFLIILDLLGVIIFLIELIFYFSRP